MKKKYPLSIWLFLLPLFLNAQMGHFPSTQIPTLVSPYTVIPNYLQNASYTNANKSDIGTTDIANIFVNYTEDTTNHNVILVYTTNGTAPTKTNGTQVTMTFYNFTNPNRTWVGAIPAQINGTLVKYVIYRNTANTGLAAANRRTSSTNSGTETTTWTEGDSQFSYYSSIDTDGDLVFDSADLDDDNDGVLDTVELYSDASTAPNGTFPVSSSAPTTPLYNKQLLFFDWSGVTLTNAAPTANKSVVYNGITYTATISAYNSSAASSLVGFDINTWSGAPTQAIWKYYNVNGTTFKEAFYMPLGLTNATITFKTKITAIKAGVSYPVDIVVFDAEASASESIKFVTDSSSFTLLT